MHKATIYQRQAHQSHASVVSLPDHSKTFIHHINKHEIMFHNLHVAEENEL